MKVLPHQAEPAGVRLTPLQVRIRVKPVAQGRKIERVSGRNVAGFRSRQETSPKTWTSLPEMRLDVRALPELQECIIADGCTNRHLASQPQPLDYASQLPRRIVDEVLVAESETITDLPPFGRHRQERRRSGPGGILQEGGAA